MKTIDLRSDTVTKPSPEMREAMFTARVGDDVYGEDPTVNLLQQRMAELTGKQAALFVPSGVMANQLAIKAHTNPGDEIVVESESHIFQYETAAPSIMSSVQIYPAPGSRGVISNETFLAAVRPQEYYFPLTRLLCLENTHNRAGGAVYPLESMKRLSRAAREKGIAVHLDGARLWNASVATGISIREYSSLVDSVSLCFSKGLGAPVGSILCGSWEFIEKAHRFRKVFGGGMRQVGLLAAGCLYALDHNVERLRFDHANAKRLAEALSDIPQLSVNPDEVETNIVVMSISSPGIAPDVLIGKLREKGVLIGMGAANKLRAVTHLDVSEEDVERAADVFREVCSN